MDKLVVGITGPRGFIGKNLISSLSLDKDIQLAPFNGNLLNEEDVDLYFQNNSDITHLVHLAGIATNDAFADLLQANVIGTSNLFKYSAKNNVKVKFIFSSSYAVYGPPVNGEESFETDVPSPDSNYGLSKKFAEDVIKFNTDNYVIARFPSVYGPSSDKGVIFNFINSIKTKGIININGDGNQIRHFLHVEDACSFINMALKSNKTGIFNVSNGNGLSLIQVVNQLKTKYSFEIKHLPENNPSKHLSMNTSKLVNTFNFTFKHTSLDL